MSIPERKNPIIGYDDRTGIITEPWYTWQQELSTRIAAIETNGAPGYTSFGFYASYGAK